LTWTLISDISDIRMQSRPLEFQNFSQKNKGIIFDIKRFALHDGSGIRTTIFLKGCPLNCWWCHNPESQDYQPQIINNEQRCLRGCMECVDVCEQNAIVVINNKRIIYEERCTRCGKCIARCPSNAIRLAGREYTLDEVIHEIEKDIIFFDQSGGGITISGGEPLTQPGFLKAILKACKQRDIHTTLDTSGYASFAVLEEILDNVDLFLYDLKLMDEAEHIKYTGVSNRNIFNNLKQLLCKGKQVIVRIPIIPGITDTEGNINQLVNFLSGLKELKEVNLIRFHHHGNQKYVNLDMNNKMKKAGLLKDSKIEEISKKFEETGLRINWEG
jgi:pyruvate formate lyase activating enzyme